jgi:tRNA(Ile)-lysidine synthase
VVWVIGYRISEKYKYDSSTKNILYLKKIKS